MAVVLGNPEAELDPQTEDELDALLEISAAFLRVDFESLPAQEMLAWHREEGQRAVEYGVLTDLHPGGDVIVTIIPDPERALKKRDAVPKNALLIRFGAGLPAFERALQDGYGLDRFPIPRFQERGKWAQKDSNLRLPPCECSSVSSKNNGFNQLRVTERHPTSFRDAKRGDFWGHHPPIPPVPSTPRRRSEELALLRLGGGRRSCFDLALADPSARMHDLDVEDYLFSRAWALAAV